MENLLEKQEGKREQLMQMKTNYNKDGDSRKTKSYLESKIAKLKTLYSEYLANDEAIREQNPPLEMQHPYLTVRKQVADTYTQLLAEMRGRLNNGPPKTPTIIPDINIAFTQLTEQKTISDQPLTLHNNPRSNQPSEEAKSDQNQQRPSYSGSSPPQESNLKSDNNKRLMKRQDILMRQMYQKLASIKYSLDTNQSQNAYCQLKMNQLTKEMEQIDSLHITMLVEIDEDEQTSNYFQENYYGVLKDEVDSMIIRLQERQIEPTTSIRAATIQLPKVELPTFHGDYEQWSSFNDIFTELIHRNNQLSDTVKMTYLKSHVQKGAAQLICHLSTTGDNYKKAWELLQSRYNNPRLLASKYFNSLLALSAVHTESAGAIRTLHDTAKEMLHNINSLNISSPFDAFIAFILSRKLDPESSRLYEASLSNPREIPEIKELFRFMERRFQSLEAMGSSKSNSVRPPYIPPLRRVNAATVNKQCLVRGCQGSHKLEECKIFKEMSTLNRKKMVSGATICVRCLNKHSNNDVTAYSCQSTVRCMVCKGFHHTLLHGDNSVSTATNSTAQTFMINQQGPVLLPTAIIKAETGNGKFTTLRTLIDPGSQATLISARAANLLNIKKKKVHVNISGIGGDKAGVCKHVINLKLAPRFEGDFRLEVEALIFDKLTQQLPETNVDTSKWTYLHNIQLADPYYNQAQSIDLVLGADYYPSIIKNDMIKGGCQEPMAQHTEFGWIIIGSMGNLESEHRTTMVSTKAIEEQLRLFVEQDNIPEERSRTEEEDKVEELFQKTVGRHQDDRYIVRIPFKDNHVKLGESRKRAVARLLQTERRFVKDSAYKELYHKFMQEYIDLNHMEPIQEKRGDDLAENVYYIPHHGVIKEDSTTTKLRVVFDASSRHTQNLSSNMDS